MLRTIPPFLYKKMNLKIYFIFISKMYTWTLENDDMTLAQIVTSALLKHPKVTFAACKKRHPLENNIDVTFAVTDSELEFVVFQQVIGELEDVLGQLLSSIN
jgi:DNA-directed RNA polymerase subunit L